MYLEYFFINNAEKTIDKNSSSLHGRTYIQYVQALAPAIIVAVCLTAFELLGSLETNS